MKIQYAIYKFLEKRKHNFFYFWGPKVFFVQKLNQPLTLCHGTNLQKNSTKKKKTQGLICCCAIRCNPASTVSLVLITRRRMYTNTHRYGREKEREREREGERERRAIMIAMPFLHSWA